MFEAIGAVMRMVMSYVFYPLEAINIMLPNIWQRTNTRFNPARDIPNLTGKVILVTGGNTGIGLETICQLSIHVPKHIYLAARSETKARQAIEHIRQEGHPTQVSWLPLDLASYPSVRNAAQRVLEEADRLDILILNAGIMATPRGQTETGHDTQLATNYIGHFLLTKLLLPKLVDTARLPNSDVRVVAVASEANLMAPAFETIISKEKLVLADPLTRYGASKASNIMFAAELARRYPILKSISVHPGLIRTHLYAPSITGNLLLRTLLKLSSWGFVSVQDGALTQLYAAAGARKQDLINGQYYTPYGKLRHNKWASNTDHGVQLWEWTEAELQRFGY